MSAGTVILIAWVLGALIVWRPFSRYVVDDLGCGNIEWPDVIMGVIIGALFAAIAWPLIGTWMLVRGTRADNPGAAARALLGEPRSEKTRRLEREKEAQAERIRELERELGIDP